MYGVPLITGHNHHASTSKFAPLVAALSVLTGSIVLVGWAFDITVLKSLLPIWVSMKPNTAVTFVLIGLALILVSLPSATLTHQRANQLSLLARLCGLLAGLIGLFTLGEYLFSLNFGIDQWLFHEPAGTVGTSNPGRMAPETALCFVLLAVALGINNDFRKTRLTVFMSIIICMLVVALALASMLPYMTPALGLFGWGGYTIMAVHTSALLTLLGIATLFMSWQQDVLPWALSNKTIHGRPLLPSLQSMMGRR